MGLLDNLISAAEQHADVDPQQHAGLLQAAMEMIGNHQGLATLQSQAQSQGLGQIVESWIGNGPNQPIAPDQVQGVIGQAHALNQLQAAPAYRRRSRALPCRESCRCWSTKPRPMEHRHKPPDRIAVLIRGDRRDRPFLLGSADSAKS